MQIHAGQLAGAGVFSQPLGRRIWLLCLGSSLVSTSSALAQSSRKSTLVASIAADSGGVPLKDAEVVIAELRQVAHTNWLGEAAIHGVPYGAHMVRVRAFGYAPVEVPVQFDNDTVPVVLFLRRPSSQLDTIKVIAPEVAQRLQGFEQRRAMQLGRYLTQVQLDSAGAEDFETFLSTRFPGLRVQSFGSGMRALASTRGSCGVDPGQTLGVYDRGTSGAGSASCFSNAPCAIPILLDGMNLNGDYDLLRTWDASAVEYYSASQVPPEYKFSGTGCGLILVWSKF